MFKSFLEAPTHTAVCDQLAAATAALHAQRQAEAAPHRERLEDLKAALVRHPERGNELSADINATLDVIAEIVLDRYSE